MNFSADLDFSSILGHVDIGILSAKSGAIKGRILEGVFDLPSYLFMLIFTLILATLLYTFIKVQTKHSLLYYLLLTLGITLGNSVNDQNPCMRLEAKRVRLVMVLILTNSLFLGQMYKNIIKSILISGGKVQFIHDLEELARFPNIKIYIYEEGFTHRIIKSSVFYDQLSSRLEDSKTVPKAKILSDVHDGSHVQIAFGQDLQNNYGEMTEEFKCKRPFNDYKFSNTLPGIPFALHFKKNFEHAEKVNVKLLRLQEAGLHRNFDTFMTTHMRNSERDGIYFEPRIDADCPRPSEGELTYKVTLSMKALYFNFRNLEDKSP